jgi:xanthine dehydrogenase accessory factor
MDIIVETAVDLLRQNQGIVLAVIISSQGSSPRMAGTRMLVAEDGHIFGTIGGGLLEARAIQTALEMHGGAPGRILTFDLTNEDAAAMEMICGGRVRVFLDRILPTEKNKVLFARWHGAMSRGKKMILATTGAIADDTVEEVSHTLLDNAGEIAGQLPLSPESIERLAESVAGSEGITVQTTEDFLVVFDPGQPRPTLYLFGAGHVARPTAELAVVAGFRVEVLDDRAEFAEAGRFPGASAVHVLSDFDHAAAGLSIDANDHIVIVTRGHLHDKTVLAQALKTPAAYIGMIGSRRKRDTIYRELLEEGFSDADLARVHCPIGMDIGAETPEEIGVSIVAEMISLRRGH